MTSKTAKPALTGQRLKTRKRDEKEKYDPASFRDAILLGIQEAKGDLDEISKFLDSAGSKLNYRRYSEVLLDILFAGGILAPGGSIVQDGENGTASKSDICVFMAKAEEESLTSYYDLFFKLIRRYKYLEKHYDEELKKLLFFLKGFNKDERQKLAMFYGITFSKGLGNAGCISVLFEEHNVKEGLSLEFSANMFKQWLKMKDINHISSVIRRSEVTSLLHLLPFNKRSQEHFENYFNEQGLTPIVEYQRARAMAETKRDLSKEMEQMISEEASLNEITALLESKKNNMSKHELVQLVWNTVMSAVEWNKKEELVTEQALKHIRRYAPLFTPLTSDSGRAELALLLKIQEYCYDNVQFMKSFSKILFLLYKDEILGEDVILKWHRDSHSPKGKSVFLEQTKSFVEWLKNAEEESGEEDEEED